MTIKNLNSLVWRLAYQ